jgi:DNA polymerase-3 subunit delta'
VFKDFFGNRATAAALHTMISTDRISQTLLLAGPEGVGKATLARRFASELLGESPKIERDDLSLEENREVIAEREKWPSEKRSDDPLLFSSHPDFVTFPPEGPLRQISIQQMRLLRERAQYKPLKGKWRVFLIDQIDRANAQAADSLLKTLEEPPDHLVLILTAENSYDLPSTIRSRSIMFHLAPLATEEMAQFAQASGIEKNDRRLALAAGCPGLALTLDIAAYEKRRGVMLALLEASAGVTPFATWTKASESFLQSKSEKMGLSIKILYGLLDDLVRLSNGGTEIRNIDLREPLSRIAVRVSFDWLQSAVAFADDFAGLERRNVQKGLALDSFVVSQRLA